MGEYVGDWAQGQHHQPEFDSVEGALGLLIRVAEKRTQQTWPRIRRELQRLVLVDLSGPAGQVSQTSKPTPAETQLFETLQVPAPIRVRAASSSSQPEAA